MSRPNGSDLKKRGKVVKGRFLANALAVAKSCGYNGLELFTFKNTMGNLLDWVFWRASISTWKAISPVCKAAVCMPKDPIGSK